MPKRTAQFVSAIFASFLAGVALTSLFDSAARAADDCLSGPKDQTPKGSHWYYRIDHASKNHCWYLREEREKLSQSKPSNSSPPAKPVAPNAATAIRPSIADARAELPALPLLQQANHDAAPTAAMPADATVRQSETGATPPNAETQDSTVASRWPDQSSAYLSTNTTAYKADPGPSAKPDSQTAPPPIVATEQFAAADLSSQTPTYSVQMQLSALVGAMALAGIIGSVIFKIVSTRRNVRVNVREHRGAIWEEANTENRSRSAFARDFDRADGREDRVAKFFSHISKRAPS
jgi:hypothetical protein